MTTDETGAIEEIDVPPTPPAAIGKHDALIERLFAEYFHGSPHMRDTEAFNHVRRFTDEIKKRLAEET